MLRYNGEMKERLLQGEGRFGLAEGMKEKLVQGDERGIGWYGEAEERLVEGRYRKRFQLKRCQKEGLMKRY